MKSYTTKCDFPNKQLIWFTPESLTRHDILAQLPAKVRELIRSFEGNIEDCEIGMKVSSKEYAPVFEKLRNDTAEYIRGLLSLTFTGSELDTAFQAIREGRW